MNLSSPTAHKTGGDVQGRKASGLLMVDGVLYMWVRNLNKDGSGASLAWSEDRAATWTWADWNFPEVGYPTWLNAGKNYSAAQDEYAYVYSPDTPSAYKTSDHMILVRVTKAEIRDKEAYRFFAGLDCDGNPKWEANFEQRRPVFTDPRRCYRPEVVFNPGIGRYLTTAAAYLERLDADGWPATGIPIPIATNGVTFGTDPTQALQVIDDPALAPFHARLRHDDKGNYLLIDHDSVAGTSVNYEQITHEGRKLQHGDIIHFDARAYRFVLRKPPTLPAPVIIIEK